MFSKEFTKKWFNDYKILIDPAFVHSVLEQAVAEGLVSLHKTFPLEKVPSSRFASVHRFTFVADRDYSFYFKQYFYRSVWDFIKHLFRQSRARRALIAADMLAKNGFLTPLVIAVGERRKLGVCLTSFLLTLEVPVVAPADQFIRELCHAGDPASQSSKRDLVRQFGAFVGRFHAAGISHGDFRIGNIMIDGTQDRYAFFLIDNERTVKHRHLSRDLRARNLFELNLWQSPYLSNTDRMRFFRSYLECNPIADWKALARQVARKTLHRLELKAAALAKRERDYAGVS